MRMRVFRLVLVTLAAFLVAGAAGAQTDEPKNSGFSCRGLSRRVFTPDVLDETRSVWGNSYSLSTDPGFGGGAAVGYKLPMGFRFEVELSYRRNDLDEFTFNGDREALDGDISSLAYLVNAWYEFDLGSGFMPYLGVGIGGATKWLDLGSWVGADDEDNATDFAYQVGGGVAYAFTKSRKTVISLDYRYFDSLEADIIGEDFDYANHNVMFGIRQHF